MKKSALIGLYCLIPLAFLLLSATDTYCYSISLQGSGATQEQYQLAFKLRNWLPLPLQLSKWLLWIFWAAAPLLYALFHKQTAGLTGLYRWIFCAQGVTLTLALLILFLPIQQRSYYLISCFRFLFLYCFPAGLLSPLFSLYRRKSVWNHASVKRKTLITAGAIYGLFQIIGVLLRYCLNTHVMRGALSIRSDFMRAMLMKDFISLYEGLILIGLCGFVCFFFTVYALRKWGIHAVIKSLLWGIGFSLIVIIPIVIFLTDRFSYRFMDLISQQYVGSFTRDGCFYLLFRGSVVALLSATAAIVTVDGALKPQPDKPVFAMDFLPEQAEPLEEHYTIGP